MLRELMNAGAFGFIIGNVLLESIFSCRLFGRVITLSWKKKKIQDFSDFFFLDKHVSS